MGIKSATNYVDMVNELAIKSPYMAETFSNLICKNYDSEEIRLAVSESQLNHISKAMIVILSEMTGRKVYMDVQP